MTEPVRVAHFATRQEAEIARAQLAAAGIDAWLHIDDAGGMLPALEAAAVLVGAADGAAARDVLGELADPEPPSSARPPMPTHRLVLWLSLGAAALVLYYVLLALRS